MQVTRLFVGVLLAVAAAACGGNGAGSAPVHDAHDAAPPTALPAAGNVETGCADSTGDTALAADAGASDLSDVAMVSDDDTVVLAFTFTGPVPARGDLVLAVEAASRDGGSVRQLGIKIHDGQPAGAFVGDSSGAAPTQLTDAVHIADDAVHAAFPISTIKDLGTPWRWYAVVGSADGIEDLCPGGKDTTLGTIGSISVG